jgi:RimJ/RimL family protein N-acetyltransferase
MNKLNIEYENDLIKLVLIKPEHSIMYTEKVNNSSAETIYFTGSEDMRVTEEQTLKYINNMQENNKRYDYLIFDKKSNNFIGEVVLNEIDYENRKANMRILIFNKKDYNKGFGNQAIKFILKHGFEALKLHRIELDVYDFNERAKYLYEKTGFKIEGVSRDCKFYNGKFCSSINMSILENEYF